jgi:hypothetical protein
MMDAKIDFQLVEVLPDGRVSGRNCRADIPLGTEFTLLYRRDFPMTKPGEAIFSPEPVFVCELSLRLDAIEMYGRHMDSIAHGYTALLTLSGTSLASLSKLLSAKADHTYYSLCA